MKTHDACTDRFRSIAIGLTLLVAGWSATAHADEGVLRVGVKEAPPFAIERGDGEWSGLAVDLWKEVARELEIPFELVSYDLAGLLDALERGEVEVGLGAITVTPEREAMFDFTHPFSASGIGVATRAEGSAMASIAARLFSLEFLAALTALGGVLMLAGLAVWIFERRRNGAQFGGSTSQGVGSAFWWAAVTMTTVGYGDKAPVTPGGRLVALVWMFVSVVTVSSFTAAIASTLTVSSLESEVRDAQDLERLRVAAISGTTGAQTLSDNGIGYRAFPTFEVALAELAANRVDAVAHDRPLLVYAVNHDHPDTLKVLPWTLLRQDYAIALAPGAALRESVNRALLQLLRDGTWAEIERRYLGSGKS